MHALTTTFGLFFWLLLISLTMLVRPAFSSQNQIPYWIIWTLAGLFIIITGFLARLHRYYAVKLQEIERTRLRLARDLHDDVGSSLSSIALTAELLQKELADNEAAQRQLARVHETAQKLSRNLKEIVWAIDPHRDKLDDLLLQMKEAAEELLAPRQIKYAVHFPETALLEKLPMAFRRNLYLIYKEALHNVCKHAQATRVDIGLTHAGGKLALQVTDNGKGFDSTAATNGNGLKSMRARAVELQGELGVEKRASGGTTVIVTVNIP